MVSNSLIYGLFDFKYYTGESMKKFFIYAHYLNERCHYIGCGNSKRPWDFFRRNENWKKVFSKQLPTVIILDEKDNFKDALKCEKYHIERMKKAGYKLANKEPAKYWLGKKRDPELMKKLMKYAHTPEARAKQSKTMMGRTLSAETKAKISKSNIGRVMSAETKAKIGEANKGRSPWCKGKKLSEETKAKISQSNKGKKMSQDSIEKRKQTILNKGGDIRKSKKVRCIETGVVYRSAGFAANELGYPNDKGIWKVVSGNRSTYKGLRWEYC